MMGSLRTGSAAAVCLLVLMSCQSTIGARIDDVGSLNNPTKSYVVVNIDNQTGKAFLATKGDPSLLLRKALLDPENSLLVIRPGNSPNIVYEVTPGTYRIVGFSVQKSSMVSNVTFWYSMDKAYTTFFKVNPGEVVYLGSFTMLDKDDSMTANFDMGKLKAELVAKYPSLEGFRWVRIDENRPSF